MAKVTRSLDDPEPFPEVIRMVLEDISLGLAVMAGIAGLLYMFISFPVVCGIATISVLVLAGAGMLGAFLRG